VGVATPFALDYIKAWLASHSCASDTQIRTAGQKPTAKQESSVEFLAGECSLYSNYLVQSSFLFGAGTAFPRLIV